MTFSDDQSSPIAPFSGDETGSALAAPDLVLQSPTTTERVVETQSGFLVVVRQCEERQALSVKRRLGTPPTSSVLLTCDESIKLSRILGDSAPRRLLTSQTGQWLPAGTARAWYSSAQQGQSKANLLLGFGVRGLLMPLLLSALLVLAIIFMTQAVQLSSRPKVVVQAVDLLDGAHVVPFVRNFVTNMLDFNPASYKVSQIRAMAVMSPELVESYWRDTNFPSSSRQLKSLPQDSTVVIQKIVSKRLDLRTASAAVYAQLVKGKSKLGSPVRLQLRIEQDSQGERHITQQTDLTVAPR